VEKVIRLDKDNNSSEIIDTQFALRIQIDAIQKPPSKLLFIIMPCIQVPLLGNSTNGGMDGKIFTKDPNAELILRKHKGFVESWKLFCARLKMKLNNWKDHAAHLIFFSSFLSFFLADSLPKATCFDSSSALAFFALFSFSICFLLVGIKSPRYAFGLFPLAFSVLSIPVSLY